MVTVHVEGIALCGPGLPDWPRSAAVLRGEERFERGPFVLPTTDLLPPAERRRMSPSVKLVLALAQAALTTAARPPSEVATVFVSSGGDGETIHTILQTLTTPSRQVSPTKFHNSVHNAPSGYWALASACREPSTTLCVHDWSFAAGLLEAAVMASVDRRIVALVAHDLAYPEPLHGVRPLGAEFGVALVLAPEPSARTTATLDISLSDTHGPDTVMDDPALEAVRLANPAARALPLLRALASGAPTTLSLATSSGGRMLVAVAPAGDA